MRLPYKGTLSLFRTIFQGYKSPNLHQLFGLPGAGLIKHVTAALDVVSLGPPMRSLIHGRHPDGCTQGFHIIQGLYICTLIP